MARAWNGFLPQNQLVKEEWDFLEACEAYARLADIQVPEVKKSSPKREREGSKKASARNYKPRHEWEEA